MAEAGPGVFERTPAGQLNSLAVVLGQEMERFNRLSEVMSSSLQELQKALKGLVVMSGELELMSTSLLNSQVSTAAVFWLHSNTGDTYERSLSHRDSSGFMPCTLPVCSVSCILRRRSHTFKS